MNDVFDDRMLDDEAACAARAIEDRYRTIFEEANDFIFTTGIDQRILSCNPATAAALGLPREEIIGRSIAEFLSPEDFDGANERLAAKLAGGGATRYELNVTGADGRRMVWEINSRLNRGADGKPDGLHVIARDMTEHHQAAAALREREERLRAMFDNAGVGMVLMDGGCRIARANAAFSRITGRGEDELIGASCLDFTHPDDVPANQEAVAAMESADGPIAFEKRYVGKQGETIWVRITLSRSHGGQVLAVVEDVTARVKAQRALLKSEALHDLIVESAVDYAIIATDLDGRVTAWNTGARNLLGYEPAEVMGRPADLIFTPEDRAAGRPGREMALALENGRALNERPHQRKDGSRLWASGLMMPLRNAPDGEPIGFVKIVQDRTEQRRNEEHLRLLVAELNHRVKNTLAIVQAIARQSLQGDGVAGAARRAFEGRLQTLAAAHSLLTRENWASADLRDIVAHALDACHGGLDRFEIEGPALRLEPKVAVTVAMALHELCTNAVKYGALSVDEGRVSIVWNVVDEKGRPRLRLSWRETGGPPVAPPARRGFGTRMIERGLASDLHGTVRLDFAPEGLLCEIDAHLPPLGKATRAPA